VLSAAPKLPADSKFRVFHRPTSACLSILDRRSPCRPSAHARDLHTDWHAAPCRPHQGLSVP
jgi:hypothetical protein